MEHTARTIAVNLPYEQAVPKVRETFQARGSAR
jgi:hypothetical protein